MSMLYVLMMNLLVADKIEHHHIRHGLAVSVSTKILLVCNDTPIIMKQMIEKTSAII